MRSVTMNIEVLVDVVRENRNRHRETFVKATEGFRKAVVAKLDAMLQNAKAGKEYVLSVSLPVPEDHTDDYDRVIGMLDHSVDSKIELTAQEYENYVRDRWGWSAGFTQTSSRYV